MRNAGNKRQPGRLFFGYFLLAKQKKVSRRRVREPDQINRRGSDTHCWRFPLKMLGFIAMKPNLQNYFAIVIYDIFLHQNEVYIAMAYLFFFHHHVK